MSDDPKDKDQEKGDEILRRLLKTPPDPKTGKAAPLVQGEFTWWDDRDRAHTSPIRYLSLPVHAALVPHDRCVPYHS